MGPVTLFDKSFLQSLSLDESVWFDHFFLSVICPIFYVETLADLAKKRKDEDRSPEDEVRIIANKTPVMSGAPCIHHGQLCISNLLGFEAPRVGQIPVAGGRPVRGAGGKPGVVFENSPEAESFNRWQKMKFHQIEHDAASEWRSMLAQLNLPEVAGRMRALGITPQTCKTVKDAAGIAKGLVHSRFEPEQQIALLFSFVNVPHGLQGEIIHRWSQAGFPSLAMYAPYAAHVLMVEIFFQIALAANLISSARPSNRADIAYLFYLPFCHVFVSGDKLHKLCAPEFLTAQQSFVWAPDLKSDLARINRELMAVPEKDREVGLHKFAPRPLGDASELCVALWNKHAPAPSKEATMKLSPEAERKLVEHLKSFNQAPTDPDVASVPADELNSISIERLVPAKKGSWWLIPKEIADAERGDRE
ncbi:hypothetical protein [Acidovorax sp.]|uniref:hypothetical protein n=1 Tax=Acidovorax sp. TaxID=1872122 RepID=UPI00391FB869